MSSSWTLLVDFEWIIYWSTIEADYNCLTSDFKMVYPYIKELTDISIKLMIITTSTNFIWIFEGDSERDVNINNAFLGGSY